MADIFISYAREDRHHAERLAKALEAEGFDAWWDRDSLRTGQSFNRSIQQALAQAKCVVVLWSGTSVGSKWVESEAYWAWDNNKLYSVRLDDSVALPVPFNTIHARSLASWDGGAAFPEFQRLVADISAVVGPRERKPEVPPAPELEQTAPAAEQAAKPTARIAPAQHTEPPVRRKPAAEPPARESAPALATAPHSDGKAVPEAPTRAPRKAAIRSLVLAAVSAVIVLSLYLGYDRLDSKRAGGDGTKPPKGPVADKVSGPDLVPQPKRQQSKAFQDCPECPEMLVIPAGTFQMGSAEGDGRNDEHPRHAVRIGKPFALGKTEITFEQWDACVAASGCSRKPDDQGWGRGDRPVIDVSWKDAQEYIAWLAKKTGKPYRLPTEAEWEYTTRAGTATPYSTGNCIDTAEANYDGNYDWGDCPKTGLYRKQTVEVGSLPANPWGLHEVHGNVWEWVQDCWNDSYQGAPADGSAWEAGDCDRRVLRGGSWSNFPGNLRSAFRDLGEPGWRKGSVGFRVARDL